MEQILIIEDDRGLNQGLCKALKADNRQLIPCSTLKSAREQLSCQLPSLILLDLNLADGSGLELLRELRQQGSRLPIILLTANDTDDDVVLGLEAGADDYITKPFSLAILRARVNTQLRRVSTEQEQKRVKTGPYFFDFGLLQFEVNGTPIDLSKTEQKLLRLLVENRGHTLARSTLTEHIWQTDADFMDENALSVTIKRLRDKLGASNPIKTVYGVGYSWVNEDE